MTVVSVPTTVNPPLIDVKYELLMVAVRVLVDTELSKRLKPQDSITVLTPPPRRRMARPDLAIPPSASVNVELRKVNVPPPMLFTW